MLFIIALSGTVFKELIRKDIWVSSFKTCVMGLLISHGSVS